MANEVLQKEGTSFIYANSTYAPGAAAVNFLGVHEAASDIDLASLAFGAARQGTKKDLGAARARQIAVTACIEIAGDPLAGETIDFYWGGSKETTAGMGNPGNLTGVDAAYAGYTASSLAEGLAKLLYIGSLPLSIMNTADAEFDMAFIGVFSPTHRYGSLVVVNNATADNLHSDSVEMAVQFMPIVDEVQ